jgi:glycosyltransferase involved in cell wall biosynthesis
MGSDPVVSVCLISYNQANYIEKAMDGILMQDLSLPWEIVIADDCSTDGTKEILQRYFERYPDKIRILPRTTNWGPGPNFVDLLLQAKGKYIAYLEGDDYWCDPSKLSQQVAYMEANTSVALTWHGYHIIDEHDRITKSDAHNESKLNFTADEFKKINSIKSLTICFRNVIREFPSNYLDCPNGDTYLYTLIGQHGGAHFIPSIQPSCYRVHSGGTWSQIQQIKKDKKAIQSFSCMAAYLNEIADLSTRDYYLDRLVKTQYVLSHQLRKNSAFGEAINCFFSSIRYAISYNKWKWIPTIVKEYVNIILRNKSFTWQHRVITK